MRVADSRTFNAYYNAMSVYKRQEIPKLLNEIKQGFTSQIYLLFGERYLGRNAAQELIDHLLPEKEQQTTSLHHIDGDEEDVNRTLNLLKTYNLFSGRKIFWVTDTKLFYSKGIAKNVWDKACEKNERNEPEAAIRYLLQMLNLAAGIPQGNILILLAEAVDKRKRLYKYIQEHGVILDLAVDPGSSSAAKRDQEKIVKELLHSTLAKHGKDIESQAIPVFLERVGFYPVAAVMEAEKLALYAGDRKVITREDVDAIIGRTREEALFELTEAVSSGKLEDGLVILDHLQTGGVHGLAILATLRNHIKKLLLVRSLQDVQSPSYAKSLPFPVFQKSYLPKLKEGREQWSNLLWKNHPYGLYMLFRQAARFRCDDLQNGLKEMLNAEYRMKSSSVDTRLIMDNLLFSLIRQKPAGVQVS